MTVLTNTDDGFDLKPLIISPNIHMDDMGPYDNNDVPVYTKQFIVIWLKIKR